MGEPWGVNENCQVREKLDYGVMDSDSVDITYIYIYIYICTYTTIYDIFVPHACSSDVVAALR